MQGSHPPLFVLIFSLVYVHVYACVCDCLCIGLSATRLLVADCWCLKCQARMEISGFSSCHMEAGQHSSAISRSADQIERDQRPVCVYP